jgi:hypothetical protein
MPYELRYKNLQRVTRFHFIIIFFFKACFHTTCVWLVLDMMGGKFQKSDVNHLSRNVQRIVENIRNLFILSKLKEIPLHALQPLYQSYYKRNLKLERAELGVTSTLKAWLKSFDMFFAVDDTSNLLSLVSNQHTANSKMQSVSLEYKSDYTKATATTAPSTTSRPPTSSHTDGEVNQNVISTQDIRDHTLYSDGCKRVALKVHRIFTMCNVKKILLSEVHALYTQCNPGSNFLNDRIGNGLAKKLLTWLKGATDFFKVEQDAFCLQTKSSVKLCPVMQSKVQTTTRPPEKTNKVLNTSKAKLPSKESKGRLLQRVAIGSSTSEACESSNSGDVCSSSDTPTRVALGPLKDSPKETPRIVTIPKDRTLIDYVCYIYDSNPSCKTMSLVQLSSFYRKFFGCSLEAALYKYGFLSVKELVVAYPDVLQETGNNLYTCLVTKPHSPLSHASSEICSASSPQSRSATFHKQHHTPAIENIIGKVCQVFEISKKRELSVPHLLNTYLLFNDRGLEETLLTDYKLKLSAFLSKFTNKFELDGSIVRFNISNTFDTRKIPNTQHLLNKIEELDALSGNGTSVKRNTSSSITVKRNESEEERVHDTPENASGRIRITSTNKVDSSRMDKVSPIGDSPLWDTYPIKDATFRNPRNISSFTDSYALEVIARNLTNIIQCAKEKKMTVSAIWNMYLMHYHTNLQDMLQRRYQLNLLQFLEKFSNVFSSDGTTVTLVLPDQSASSDNERKNSEPVTENDISLDSPHSKGYFSNPFVFYRL